MNADLFYDIVNNKIDKKQTWYDVSDNVVFLTGEQYKTFGFVTEALSNDGKTIKRIILLSEKKLNSGSRLLVRDSYNRLKYRPVAHKEYFKTASNNKDVNVNLIEDISTDEYVAYIVFVG